MVRNRHNRTYVSWRSMLGRCYDEGNASYCNYGAKGVTVCERWLSFDAFVADMGERPTSKTLDRLDPLGDYGPDNCRWASAKEQQRRRRATKLTYEKADEIRKRRSAGEQGKALAKEFGVSQQVICDIHKGRYWHPDEVD